MLCFEHRRFEMCQFEIPIPLAQVVLINRWPIWWEAVSNQVCFQRHFVSILWPMVVAHSISQLVEIQLFSFVEDSTVNTFIEFARECSIAILFYFENFPTQTF